MHTFKIAMMGDAMLHRDVQDHFFEKPDDFTFPEINNLLSEYHYRFLNLENPIGENGTPNPIQNPRVTFCSHPKTVQILKNLHINGVTLANNHMLDYGQVALAETLENMQKNGIEHVGAGKNYDEANTPIKTEINGVKVAILGHVFIYSASTDWAREDRGGVSDHRIDGILKQIRQLKSEGYVVIVSIHWGIEYGWYMVPYKQRQAREMIDAGASLIMGHGPHYFNGMEDYKGGRILYSLGNFIFDEPYFFANRSFIYGIEIAENGELRDAKMYPYRIENHIPKLMNDKDKKWVETRVHALSKLQKRKDEAFWQDVNDTWFRDLMFRCRFMRSFKFLSLPPKEYFKNEVRYAAYAKYMLGKFLPGN